MTDEEERERIMAEAREHIAAVKAGNFSAPAGSVVRDVHRNSSPMELKKRAYSGDVVRKARARTRRTTSNQSKDGFDDYVAVSIERVLGLWEEMRQRHREPPRARTLDANGIDSDAWNRWGAEVADQRISLALNLIETQRLMLHRAVGRALAEIRREERERTEQQIAKAISLLREELITKRHNDDDSSVTGTTREGAVL